MVGPTQSLANLISFSYQVLPVLESHALETALLKRAIKVAEKLISTSNLTLVSHAPIQRSDKEFLGRFSQIIKADKDFVWEKLTADLKNALQEAQNAQNPLAVIQEAYTSLEKFLAANTLYRPFLRDARRLMERLMNNPLRVRNFLLPLLQKVFVDSLLQDGFILFEGEKFAARLIYIADKDLWSALSGSFDAAFKEMGTRIAADFWRFKDNFEGLHASYSQLEICDSTSLETTMFPQEVAKVLVSSDGTLNLGLRDIVEETFLAPLFGGKQARSSLQLFIAEKLKEFQQKTALLTDLENTPVPSGKAGRTTINAMLFRFVSQEISAYDTHVALLTALLTPWRQDKLENCFVTTIAIQRQQIWSEQLLDDLKNLLSGEGSVSQTVEGRIYKFYGLQWPLHKVLCCDPQPFYFNVRLIRQACRLLGCTELDDFNSALEAVKKADKEAALYAVFEELQKRNGKPIEALQEACWHVESLGQNLLLRQWENTFGSMIFLPIVENNIPVGIMYSSYYFKAIANSFLKVADRAGLSGVKESLSTFAQLFEQHSPCLVSYSGLIPPLLRQLRATLIPQSLQSSGGLSWVLGVEKEGRFIPFKDHEHLATYLRDVFLEWIDITGQSIDERTKKNLFVGSELELVESFEHVLLEQEATKQQGVIADTLCYSMRGGGVIMIEKSSIDFGNWEQKNFSADLETGFRLFLKWTQEIRQKIGDLDELTLQARTLCHGFRFLPNDPSIRAAMLQQTDPLEKIRQNMHAHVCEEMHPIEECLEKLAPLFLLTTLTVFEKTKGAKTDTCGNMGQSVKEELGACKTCSYVNAAKAAMNALKKFDDIYAQYTDKQLFIICLNSLWGPDYLDQFIHFADSNEVTSAACGATQAQYILWFDPRDSRWDIIGVPKITGPFLNGPPIFFEPTFFQTFFVYTKIEPLAEALRQKNTLILNRKVNIALQKLERALATVWKSLAQTH